MMKKRFAKVAVAGLGALGLLVTQTPAQASHAAGAVAFVGSATVNPGLYYPLPGNPGSTGTWSFNLGTAVGVAATAFPAATAVGTASGSVGGSLEAGSVQTLLAEANGTLGYLGSGGFCGASGGYGGTGSITVTDAVTLTPLTSNVANVGWKQSVATVIAFSGDAAGDTDPSFPELVGVVSAIPTTGSCTNGTATAFTVVGASAIADL